MRKVRLLIILLFCVSAFGLRPSVHAQARAKWTVMVFMAANNNLEPNSVFNLMEMSEIGSSDSVNVVVQITRPPDYKGFYGEWGGTRRFLVTRSDRTQLSAGDFQISQERFGAFLKAVGPDAGIDAATIDKITKAPRAEEEKFVQQLVPAVDPTVPLPPLQIKSVQDLGTKVNSGSADSLIDFGQWAVKNYPADHYALVLWDHGGGWSMVASDDTLGPEGISMPDLQNALKAITTAAGVDKLDLVGFDACLMGQVTIAVTVAPYAKYMIAAEELVPGLGWNYAPPLQSIADNGSASDLGKATIDSFNVLYGTVLAKHVHSFDMGLFDLSKTDGLITALTNFADAYKANADEQVKIVGAARQNVQEFAAIGEKTDVTEAFSSVDLIHLMKLIAGSSKNPAIDKATKDVIDAARAMVLYHKASSSLPDSNGLSIFFPRDAGAFAAADGERYTKEFGTSLAGWQSFLNAFYATAKSQSSATASPLKIKVTGVIPAQNKPASIHDVAVISYDASGKNIVDVSAVVVLKLDDKTNAVLDAFPIESQEVDPDGNTVNLYSDTESSVDFYWSGTMNTLSDGTTTLPVLMTTNSDDKQHGFIVGTFTDSASGKKTDAYVTVNLDSYEVESVWGTQTSSSTSGSTVAQITVSADDTFEPVYQIIDDKGNVQRVPSGKALKFGAKPFTVKTVPAIDGNYTIVLVIRDAAGNQAVDATTVNVKNDGLDASLRGFKDISLGVQLLYPWDWTDVSTLTRQDGTQVSSASNVNGDMTLSIEGYNVATPADAVAQAKNTLSKLNGVSVTGPTDLTVGTYAGQVLKYGYTNADGIELQGTAVVLYVSENKRAYVVSLETTPDKADAGQAILNKMLGTLAFFPPQ